MKQVQPLEYQPPSPPLPHSVAGISSILLAMVFSPVMVVLYLGVSGGVPEAVPLIVFATWTCPLFGAAFGVAGIYDSEAKPIMAIIGLSLNGVIIILLAIAIIAS